MILIMKAFILYPTFLPLEYFQPFNYWFKPLWFVLLARLCWSDLAFVLYSLLGVSRLNPTHYPALLFSVSLSLSQHMASFYISLLLFSLSPNTWPPSISLLLLSLSLPTHGPFYISLLSHSFAIFFDIYHMSPDRILLLQLVVVSSVILGDTCHTFKIDSAF